MDKDRKHLKDDINDSKDSGAILRPKKIEVILKDAGSTEPLPS